MKKIKKMSNTSIIKKRKWCQMINSAIKIETMCEQKKNGLVEKTYEQLFLLTTAAKIDQRWVWTNEKK